MRVLPSNVEKLEALQKQRAYQFETPKAALREFALMMGGSVLLEPPVDRKYLLWEATTGRGIVACGKVGLLAAKGGSGKTMSLLLLGVCKVLGLPWFGSLGWETRKPGRVLMVLGEEDAAEVLRRLHSVVRALGVSDPAQLELIAQNLVVLPLAGVGVALTYEADGDRSLPETPRVEEIRQLEREATQAGTPYDLIIFDPLSRFAGSDVEKDNAAATRFVQVAETFTAPELGSPAVLIAHHLRKAGKDDDGEASELIRGAVALHDGVRLAIILAPQRRIDGAPELLRLRVVKSNYAPVPAPLVLCREEDGTLRVATSAEVEAYRVAGGNRGAQASSVDENVERLVEILADGRERTREEIREELAVSKATSTAAVEAAESRGLIRKAGHKRGYLLISGAKE